MVLVLGCNAGSQADDKHVSEADDRCHDPHEHTQNDVGQQVFKRGNPIGVRLTTPHVRRVAAVFKPFKISEVKDAK